MAVYLVTGGAGFIGSHIAQALVERGEEVRILDNFSTGRRANLAWGNQRIVIEGDVRERSDVERAVDGVDFVVHQAALASVQRSIDDPVETDEVNVRGTLNLLEAAVRFKVRRLVYASSSSVYGDSEELPKHERMLPLPKSPYGVSKLAAEWYCRVFSEVYGMPTVSLRYFNVYGPRQDPDSPYAAVIPVFIKSLIDRTPPTIYGDGEQSRDFTYVDSVVSANLRACDSTAEGAHVYNVACGDRYTLNAVFSKLQEITGARIAALNGPPRPGDVRHSQAAIEEIRNDLGYHVEVGLDEGLKRTAQWFLEQSRGAS